MTSKSFGVKNIDVSNNLNVSGVGTFTTGLDLDGYLKDVNDQQGSNGQILTSTGDGVSWSDISAVSSNSGSTGISFTDLNDTPSALGGAGQLVAVNSGATGLAFTDFSAPNLGSGALPSDVTIPQSQITDPLTYQLKARPDEDGGGTGDDDNPYLFLDASTGTDDAVQLFGDGAVTITRNSNKKITISATNTVPGNGTITLKRNGSSLGSFTLNQTNSEEFNFIDTDNDTNYYLSSVSSSFQNVGDGSASITFGMTGANDLSLDTNTIGVKYIYNHLMSENSNKGPDNLDKYQFMMCDPNTGYRRAVTDAKAQFDTENNRAEFRRLSVSSTKSFVIDHPLGELTDAPKLQHSCIEGPELTTFYRGKIELVDGTATINIDTVSRMTEGTFVALNRNIQSFTTNETGWTQVKSSVSGNVLTIIAQDSSCTDTISWMVLGERKDDAAMESYDENDLYKAEIN
jgi:hypothetical protein